MRAKQKIVQGQGPYKKNLDIFVCSAPSINYEIMNKRKEFLKVIKPFN